MTITGKCTAKRIANNGGIRSTIEWKEQIHTPGLGQPLIFTQSFDVSMMLELGQVVTITIDAGTEKTF